MIAGQYSAHTSKHFGNSLTNRSYGISGCLCAKDYLVNTTHAVEQSPGKRYCLIGILKNYDWNKGMLLDKVCMNI